MIIFGKEYNLDQDFADDDKISLLKDEDSDILFEYGLSHEVTGDEALCELWLRWQNLFRYKPSELKSEQYIQVLMPIFHMGKVAGKQEKLTDLIQSLQTELAKLNELED